MYFLNAEFTFPLIFILVFAVFDLSILNCFYQNPTGVPRAVWEAPGGVLGSFLNTLWSQQEPTGAPLADLLAPSERPGALSDVLLGRQGLPRTLLVSDLREQNGSKYSGLGLQKKIWLCGPCFCLVFGITGVCFQSY